MRMNLNNHVKALLSAEDEGAYVWVEDAAGRSDKIFLTLDDLEILSSCLGEALREGAPSDA